MKTIEHQGPVVIHNLEELTEICKAAGAAASTVICSTGKVVVYYRDPHTSGIHDADFVDELHFRHRKNAKLLIAVFPVDNLN
jgi:hypothetical protein